MFSRVTVSVCVCVCVHTYRENLCCCHVGGKYNEFWLVLVRLVSWTYLVTAATQSESVLSHFAGFLCVCVCVCVQGKKVRREGEGGGEKRTTSPTRPLYPLCVQQYCVIVGIPHPPTNPSTVLV